LLPLPAGDSRGTQIQSAKKAFGSLGLARPFLASIVLLACLGLDPPATERIAGLPENEESEGKDRKRR
jgi:hypothetical protein